jgi:enolase-phosphatase E1
VRFACFKTPRAGHRITQIAESIATISRCAWGPLIFRPGQPILEVTLHERSVCAVVLDIEGTTTPLDFVYEALFPYARSHLRQFLSRHRLSRAVGADIAELNEEYRVDTEQGLNPPRWRDNTPEEELESVVEYIEWLMDRDRKSRSLKSLQGRIWEEGYKRGELRGQIFDDVPRALQRWQNQEKKIAIFSSGSVLAQKLLFAHTTAGDLSRHISHYFDTTAGSKTDKQSYQEIASVLQLFPSEIAFISDVATELDAAKSAGMHTLLCLRPGNRPQPASTHILIQTLDEVFP